MIISLLSFLLCAILAWLFNELELIPWRRAPAAHWTERARLLHPARVARQMNVWALPITLTLASRFLFPDSPWGLVLFCGLLGALLGNFPMDQETTPGLTFAQWTPYVLGSWLMLGVAMAILGLAAYLMPAELDWTAGVITLGFFALQLGLQFGLGLRLMRFLRLLRPASARLQSLVAETSTAMGVPVRTTWEMSGPVANAVAFVATRELGFTGKLEEICPDDEIKAICAHELGHLTESRWALVVRLIGGVNLFPLIFMRPAYALGQEAGVFLLGVAVLLIWVCNGRLAQAMEKRADKIARESIAESAVYARALERLYRDSQMVAVQNKGSGTTHPDLYDRMVAAGLTPDYPRPTAPAKQGWTGYVAACIGVLLALWRFIPTL